MFHDKLESCLHSSWDRAQYQDELEKFVKSALSPTSGQWTSVEFQVRGGETMKNTSSESGQNSTVMEGAGVVTSSPSSKSLVSSSSPPSPPPTCCCCWPMDPEKS